MSSISDSSLKLCHIYILLTNQVNIYFVHFHPGAFNRCFKCRSRGDLGSCKDPFKFNASALEGIQGVDAIPCTSGWCGKILDRGSNSFKDEGKNNWSSFILVEIKSRLLQLLFTSLFLKEYGAATERLCLQRGPDDNEERCAPTTWGHEKVYMCFCQGDLCNAADKKSPALILLFVLIGFMNW